MSVFTKLKDLLKSSFSAEAATVPPDVMDAAPARTQEAMDKEKLMLAKAAAIGQIELRSGANI